MTNNELKHKLTKIALCDDGYKRVCLVNELEEELSKGLEVLEIFKELIKETTGDNGYMELAGWFGIDASVYFKNGEQKQLFKEWIMEQLSISEEEFNEINGKEYTGIEWVQYDE